MWAALGEPGISRYSANTNAFGMLSMLKKITQGSGLRLTDSVVSGIHFIHYLHGFLSHHDRSPCK